MWCLLKLGKACTHEMLAEAASRYMPLRGGTRIGDCVNLKSFENTKVLSPRSSATCEPRSPSPIKYSALGSIPSSFANLLVSD
jgi:hypothetical protein